MTFTIAIDGPAASGKGTISRRLADELGFHHLDTGLTYRAVGHALMQVELPLDNEELAKEVARNIDLGAFDRDILSAHEIGEAASQVAVMSGVREILVNAQREFAKREPGSVLDGRDIGTVVCPDADVKLFVVADPEVRAKRRFDEVVANGSDASFEQILADIVKRDERDTQRKDSPLKPAQDAHLIDTSKMGIETAFQTVIDIVKDAINHKE